MFNLNSHHFLIQKVQRIALITTIKCYHGVNACFWNVFLFLLFFCDGLATKLNNLNINWCSGQRTLVTWS